MFYIFCNSKFFTRIWNYYCGIDDSEKERIKKSASNLSKEDAKEEKVEKKPGIEFSDGKDLEKNKSYVNSLTKKTNLLWTNFKKKFNTKNSSYFILIFVTIFLSMVQILFAHRIVDLKFIENTRNTTIIKQICSFSETYYMFEDIVYLPFSLLFLLILYFTLRSQRFNRYIMIKYKSYFKSSFFQEIQKKNRDRRLDEVKKKEDRLKERNKCRYCLYKCCTKKMFDILCCCCCCSCFVPPGSNTKCFLCYCCCLGWKQTNVYKVLSRIGHIVYRIFYCLLLCFIWSRLWKMTQSRRQQLKEVEKIEKKAALKEKKRLERKAKRQKDKNKDDTDQDCDENEHDAKKKDDDDDKSVSSMSTEIDNDEDFDEDDYDITTQTIHRHYSPFPSSPFSTYNRAQSAAIYIIYTYDVLNIFMSLFVANISMINLPFFGNLNTTGVIVTLVIQLLQVFIIGLKFYPILVVADAKPNVFIYFLSFLYILFIWMSRFFKKTYCSRTEAFIAQQIKQFGSNIGHSIKESIGFRYNVSNTIFGLFSDAENPNEKYMSALKEKIPNTFKEFFGKYNPNNNLDDNAALIDDQGFLSDMTTSNVYYSYTNMPMNNFFTYTTTTLAPPTVSTRFRDKIKNDTIYKIKSFKQFFYQREEGFITLVSILENLPFYLTLSYLLTRYGLLFVGTLIAEIKKCIRPKQIDPRSAEVKTLENLEQHPDFQRQFSRKPPDSELSAEEINSNKKKLESILNDLNKGYLEQNTMTDQIINKRNTNYCYIKGLFKDFSLWDKIPSEKSSQKTYFRENTFVWRLFEKYVYQNVPYLRYSRQYINTYAVAFMVVYFFTIFGMRLSNIFGNALVGSIEFAYKIIFRGLLPTFDTDKHNFNTEFRTACVITSLISFHHLFSGIKKFQSDLMKLHKGEKFFSSIVMRYKDDDYSKIVKKRNKESVTIATDSLHFPGYLVAHLVYGYVLLFLGIFVIIVICKLLFYFDTVLPRSFHLLLPVFIIFGFNFVFLKCLVITVLLRGDNQRITSLSSYFLMSYFSFFLDCFIGLVACMSRVWQTTIISMLRLPRLDTSMFNSNDQLLMRRLDKGHLAYLNYVRMEHWYNNPILNGFCEMLLESMFYSQVYKAIYEARTQSSAHIQVSEDGQNKLVYYRSVSRSAKGVTEYNVISKVMNVLPGKDFPRQFSRSVSFNNPPTFKPAINNIISMPEEEEENEPGVDGINAENFTEDELYNQIDVPSDSEPTSQHVIKQPNTNFKYTSFLRLRNMMFLCLLLKKNPSLRKYRQHYLLEMQRRQEIEMKKMRNQSFNEFYNERFKKFTNKINLKIRDYLPNLTMAYNKSEDAVTNRTNVNESNSFIESGENIRVNIPTTSNLNMRHGRKLSI